MYLCTADNRYMQLGISCLAGSEVNTSLSSLQPGFKPRHEMFCVTGLTGYSSPTFPVSTHNKTPETPPCANERHF